MFAFNYALEAANLANLAFEVTTDALGLTTDTSVTPVSIEEETVEFKTVGVKTDGIQFTELDDDDFTLVTAPSGFVPREPTPNPSYKEYLAAFWYLHTPNPTTKRTFLSLAGYDTPDVVPDDVAKTMAEACVQVPGCQSLDRQRKLMNGPTSNDPLTSLVRADHFTPAGP